MYKCPKCGGTDLYRGKKQVEYGMGLSRMSREEMRSFCRKCDIEAVYYSTSSDVRTQWIWAGVIFVAGLIGIAIWSNAGFPVPF